MLRLKIGREAARAAIEYHAFDGDGVTPVIEDDTDLLSWFRRVIGRVGGREPEELIGMGLEVVDGDLLVALPDDLADVVDDIRFYVL